MRAQHPARHARTTLECTAAGDRPGKTEPPQPLRKAYSAPPSLPRAAVKKGTWRHSELCGHLALHSACNLKQVISFPGRGTSAFCVVNRGASLQ